PLPARSVGALQVLDALVADAEVQPAVRADQDAVDAVVVVHAAEAGEQLLRWPIGLAVPVLVLEQVDVRRLADVDLPARPDRVLGHGDPQRRLNFRRLGEYRDLVRPALSRSVLQDQDTIALGPQYRLAAQDLRPEGDRILILEDASGKGRA